MIPFAPEKGARNYLDANYNSSGDVRFAAAGPDAGNQPTYPGSVPIRVGEVPDNRYRLDQLIGRGGTAAAFRATNQLLGRSVAVKIFHSHLDDPTTLARNAARWSYWRT